MPGLFQSMSLFGRKSPLKIYGPKGLFDFVKAFKETVKFSLTFQIDIKEIDKEYGVIYKEKEYSIEAIRVDHTITAFAYALIEAKRPGIFYPENANNLGITKGPLWSMLQHGNEIMLTNGQTINPRQVTGPKRSGRKIVYSGDTRPCANILKISKNADVLIYEATLDDTLSERAKETGHSTPSQAATIAEEAKAKHLILTHISGRYTNTENLQQQARKIFYNTIVARDFMDIKVAYTD